MTSFSGSGNEGLQIGQNEGMIAASVNNTGTVNNYFDSKSTEGTNATQYVQSLSREYRREKDVNPSRTPRTCEWLLNDPRFQTWHRAIDARLLHIVAGPGCGKSVLAKALVDESLAENAETRATLYFFFKTGQGNQDQASSAVASMLHQLYTQIPDRKLTNVALPKFQAHGQNLSHMWNELWDILISSAEYLDGHTLCVIDALDECKEEDREPFISTISKLYAARESNGGCKVKILVTSRPYPGIGFQNEFPGERTNVVHFDADEKSSEVAEEINRVIEDRIPTIIPQQVGKDVQRTIIDHLQAMDNRTYLWLHLIFDHIKRNIFGHGTKKGLKKLISELPQSVNTAYDTMLHRSPNPRVTKSLLSLVLCGRRPMSVTEVKIALELSQESCMDQLSSNSLELETDDQFRETLKALCGLILMVRDSHVYTLHETVREFLQSGVDPMESAHQWKGSIDPLDAETLLTKSCMLYLNFKDFENMPAWVKNHWHKDIIPDYSSYIKRRAFFNYSAEHWCDHFRKSQKGFQETQSQLAKRLLQKAVLSSHPWIFEFEVRWAMEVSFRSSVLLLACYCGMDSLVSVILSSQSVSHENTKCSTNQNYAEEHCGSPDPIDYAHALAAASNQGHETTIRLLLSSYALRNGKELPLSDQEKALMVTLRQGHPTVAKIFLDNLGSVEPTYSLSANVLLAARRSGDAKTIQTLLDHHCSAKIRRNLPTEICAAARLGDFDILEVFLDSAKRLNIEISQEEYNDALTEAVRESRGDILFLIIAYAREQTNFQITKPIFETAVWFADSETLVILLVLKVEVDISWLYDFFEIAIRNNDLEKLLLLLNFQAYRPGEWVPQYSPLMALAVLCQHFEIFEFLFKCAPEGIKTPGYEDALEKMILDKNPMVEYAFKAALRHETAEMPILPPKIRSEALGWPSRLMLSYK